MTSVYSLYYEYDDDDNFFRIVFQTLDKELCVKQALYQADIDDNPDRVWCVGETIIHRNQTRSCRFYHITEIQGRTFSTRPNFQEDPNNQFPIYLVYTDPDTLPIFISFDRQDCLNFMSRPITDGSPFGYSLIKANLNFYNEEQYRTVLRDTNEIEINRRQS